MSKDNSPFILNNSGHDLLFNLFDRKHHKVNSRCLKGDNFILKEFQIPSNIISIDSSRQSQNDKIDEASLQQLKSTKTDLKSNDNSGNTNDSNSSPKSQEDKNIQEEPPKVYKYYLSSTPKSLIQIEGTIGTDDDDLNHFIGIVTRKSIISYFYTNNIKDKIK